MAASQSGTFANVPFVVIENYNNDRRADIDSLGWNTAVPAQRQLEPGRRPQLVARRSAKICAWNPRPARARTTTRPCRRRWIRFPSRPTADGITHFTPTLDYSDYNTVFLTDPGGWGGGPRRSGFVGNPEIEDEIKAIRLSAERKLDIGSWMDVDVRCELRRAREGQGATSRASCICRVTFRMPCVPEEFRTGITNTSFFGSPHGMIGYNAIGLYRSRFLAAGGCIRGSESGRGQRRSSERRHQRLGSDREAHDRVREGRNRYRDRQPAAYGQHRRAERHGRPVFGHQLFLGAAFRARRIVQRIRSSPRATSTPMSCRA